MNPSLNEKYVLASTPTAGAAGQTDVASAIIDTVGFEGVKFLVPMGAITSGAVTSAKAQQNSANSTSGMADLAGTSVTIADTDDNKMLVIDVNRPRERYVRALVDRATQDAVVGGIIAVLYGPRKAPVVNDDATVIAVKTVVSPEEA